MLVNPPPVSTLLTSPLQCMFSVCVTDNMNSITTNKTCTSPKWVCTQAHEEQDAAKNAPFSSTPSSFTKAAKDALKLAVASLQTSLQPPINHFSQKIITTHCK